MPQWTATLEDGTQVTLEGDTQPSEQDFIEAVRSQPPKVSATRAFTQHAVAGIGPGAAFMAAFPAGAKLGAGAGALVPGAGETGLSELIGGGIGGLITGSAAAWAASKAQQKLVEAALPEFAKQTEQEMAAGEEQHPLASVAGEVASLSPSAKLAPFKLAQLPLRAALGAGISAGVPLLQGRAPSLRDIGAGAATTALYGEGRFPAPFGGPRYASRQQKAAEVHGPVQPQPVQGEGQVPAQEGGPGVQPPAQGGLAEGTQIPLKKGPTYLTGQRGEVGEDPEKGWYVQFGNRREYGFETVFEAKRVLDEVESGQRTIVGEMVPMPEDNIAAATYTDPETGETTIAPHHPGAAEEQGVDAEGPREEREGPEFGFVTETGEPLTRPEAEVKAGETGQAMPEVQKKPGVPHSDEIKAAGTEAPISETSDLDQIMDKIERGHKLTPAEEALFDAQISSPGTKPKPNQLELALKKEANKVSKKVDVKDEPPTPDATVPFASNIVYLDPKSGRLVVNRKEFLDTMSKIPQQNHKAYIERLVNEEHIHSKVSDDEAQSFFDNATATERALAFKQYTGFDTNEQLFKARGTRLSDTALGHEMVRQRLQQLSHMGVREIIELSGREKWNARFIDSLQRLIYNLRKALGTRASRIQQDIINRMQGNLDAVKAERGEPKGAFKKGGEEEPVPDIAAMASEVGFSTFDKRLNEFLDREGLPRNSWPAEARKNVFEALQAVAGNKEAEDIAVKEAQARLQAEKGLTEMGLPPGKITAARQRLLDKVKKTLRPPEQPLGAFAKRPPEEMSEPIRGFAGELTAGRVRTREAVQAGLGARSIDDLNDLANLRQEWGQKATEAREKGFPAETMQDVFKAQYPREAIEAATNTGSHQEHEISHGPRPLDWREHPEVADWLQKNAKSLGITLPDELEQVVPGAFKKGPGDEAEEEFGRRWAEEESKFYKKHGEMTVGGQIVQRHSVTEDAARALWHHGGSIEKAKAAYEKFLQEDFMGQKPTPQVAASIRRIYAEMERIKSSGLEVGNTREEGQQSFPGAFKKESKAEREARIARERATEPMPGFGGPAYSEALPLKGEAPPAPAEKLSERAGPGEGVPSTEAGKVFTDRYSEDSLKKEVAAHVESADPSLADLTQRWREQYGIGPETTKLMYEQALWPNLLNASGDRLRKMVKSLNLERIILSREAKKKELQLGEIPGPSEEEKFKLVGEIAGGRKFSRDELEDIRKQRVGREKFRNRVVRTIADKLLEEVVPEKGLVRSDIDIEDIAWGDPNAAEGPFYEFTRPESYNRAKVARIASQGARRSEKDNETITRRLIAMVDRLTGKVELADAYPKGWRVKAETEPGKIERVSMKDLMVARAAVAGVGAKHKSIFDLPSNLRPLYTILLKDPVQHFHKVFKSVSDFNNYIKIGEAIGRNQRAEDWITRGQPTPTEFEEPETQAPGGQMFAGPTHGPGGTLIEPKLAAAPGPGELTRPSARQEPMTPNEASAIFRVADELEVTTPHDLRAMVDIMAESAKDRNGLRGRYATAISGLDKAVARTYDDLLSSWKEEAEDARKAGMKFDKPQPTEKDAYDLALEDLFIHLTGNEGYGDYIQRAMGQYGGEVKPPVQLTAPTPVPTTGRTEGVSREVALRGATAKTPLGAPAGPRFPRPAGRFPLPRTAEEPLTKTPEQLPAGAVPGVEAHAAAEFPYTPTGEAEKLVEQGKPTGRILKYGAPEFRTKTGLLGPRHEEPIGAFYKRPMDKGEEIINQATRGIVAMVKRDTAFDEIAAGRDRASNDANNFANKIGNFLRRKAGAREAKGIMEIAAGKVWHGDPEKKAAAIAMIQAGFDYDKLAEFRLQVSRGEHNARALIQNGNWWQKIKGRKWLEYQGKLKKEIDYADEHWDDQDLQTLAKAAHGELDAQYNREIRAGHNVKYDPDYTPGRYEAEFFNDNATVFGQLYDVLGRNWKAPKTFRSYYAASAEEPYLAKSRDIADIVEHRVRQGMNRINYDNWVNGFKNISDEVSGKMVASNPIKRPDGSLSPADNESVLMPLRRGYNWISVRKGYEPLIRDLTNSSAIQNNTWGRNALQAAQALKHTMLIGDVFHLGRVAYYGMSLQRRVAAKFRGGLAALEWREQDLPEAVRAGLVSPEQAKWATEKINVNVGGGQTVPMSRIQIADLGLKSGLNNGRILDALYKETVGWVPGIGRYNRWLFDRVTRGFITQSFVHNFEALNAKHPNLDASVLARDVSKDINSYFGNIGRQGWFKSETYQDLARLAFLAPQWVEGLVKKEVGFYSRLARAPVGGRGDLPRLGALGSGIATGLVTMIGITQALNLLFRKQPTWMNEEKGHKFDAFIRTGGPDEGYWFSPLAVFNELSHDVVRLIETKPKLWDVFSQIGENKLSPYGRLGMIAARSQTPTGQYLTTTPGVMGAMAGQLIPTPISASKPLQALGHAVAPGMVPALKPGALGRQLAATAGLKIEPNAAPAQQAHALADDFMLANPELKKDSGWMQVQTDEPNYSKLRSAIRSGDDAHAMQQFEELRKTRKYQDIVRAMKLASRRPFTGSHANERRFLYTLSPQQLDLYSRAQEQRQSEYEAFLAWLSRSEAQ